MHGQLVVLFENFQSWRHQTGNSFNFFVYRPILKMKSVLKSASNSLLGFAVVYTPNRK